MVVRFLGQLDHQLHVPDHRDQPRARTRRAEGAVVVPGAASESHTTPVYRECRDQDRGGLGDHRWRQGLGDRFEQAVARGAQRIGARVVRPAQRPRLSGDGQQHCGAALAQGIEHAQIARLGLRRYIGAHHLIGPGQQGRGGREGTCLTSVFGGSHGGPGGQDLTSPRIFRALTGHLHSDHPKLLPTPDRRDGRSDGTLNG